jgi:hypothetical protein
MIEYSQMNRFNYFYFILAGLTILLTGKTKINRYKVLSFFRDYASKKVAPEGQQARCLFSDAKYRCQVSGVRKANR